MDLLSYIFGIALCCTGIILISRYFSTVEESKVLLGSTIFQLGLLFLVRIYYNFPETGKFLVPAFLLIIAFDFLMLYLSSTKNKGALYIFVVFFLSGWMFSSYLGALSLRSLIFVILDVFKFYWIVIVLIILVVIIYIKKVKK